MSGPARQLLLLGADRAHLQLLADMAQAPWAGAQVTLIHPHGRVLSDALLPGWVAGRYAPQACAVALEPLLRRSGVRWLQRNVSALDASAQTLQLEGGLQLPYDWLSLNTGPLQDRTQTELVLPGAREHALFLRPLETFATLWPQVAALGQSRALRIAVVGADALGMALALAIRQCLPHAAITLLCGDAPLAAGYAPGVPRRLRAALRKRNITVLPDRAAGMQAGVVWLASGASLACDVPLLTQAAPTPGWLRHSGLALDGQGGVAVDAHLRSTSHPPVFATSHAHGRARCVLARNLAATLAGQALAVQPAPRKGLELMDCGDACAIATWGRYSAQGRWLGWLKNWTDRREIQDLNPCGFPAPFP